MLVVFFLFVKLSFQYILKKKKKKDFVDECHSLIFLNEPFYQDSCQMSGRSDQWKLFLTIGAQVVI